MGTIIYFFLTPQLTRSLILYMSQTSTITNAHLNFTSGTKSPLVIISFSLHINTLGARPIELFFFF